MYKQDWKEQGLKCRFLGLGKEINGIGIWIYIDLGYKEGITQ